MKLHSLAMSLIIIGRLLTGRAQVQATEEANADDPFGDIWQNDDTTNMPDSDSTVSGDDGAETPMTTQRQSEWSVTERSTKLSNQETITVNLNATVMMHNNSETMPTVTEPLYQYEMSRASLMPVSIIDNEATTEKISRTPHLETQRDRLTTLKATMAHSADVTSSNSAEDLAEAADSSSTNYNNFVDVTARISDETQENDASEISGVSSVSMYSVENGATTLSVPLLSTGEIQRSVPTTLQPTRTTTANGISSNAAELFSDGSGIDSTNTHYFTEVTVTEPDDMSDEANEIIATTLPTSVYSVNSDVTAGNVVSVSAGEMQRSTSTTSEPTKTTTASENVSNAPEDFTNGADNGASTVEVTQASAEEMQRSMSNALEVTKKATEMGTDATEQFTADAEGDSTSSHYFSEAALTKQDEATEENVASETVTAPSNVAYSVYFTNDADGTTNSSNYFSDVTVTEPDDETLGSASGETMTAPLASMYSVDSGATTVETARVSAEKTLWGMSTALEPTDTWGDSSSNAAEEFTTDAEGDHTNNHYFTEAMLTKSGDLTEVNDASETVTVPLTSMYSVGNGASTVEVTHASAEDVQRSMSNALEVTKTITERSTSPIAADQFTAEMEGDITSNYDLSEATLTKPGEETEENVASEAVTASSNVVYSVDSSAAIIELTDSSAEITRRGTSTTSKPTEMSTASGISSNTAEGLTDGTDGDGTSNHYFTEITLIETDDQTSGNVATDAVTASLASMYSSAAWVFSSNAAAELTFGTDGDSTNKAFTDVTLTDPGDQTKQNIASETTSASLVSMYSADSAATAVDVTYSSAEEMLSNRSATSEPTRTTTANGIASNTAEEFTDRTDAESSNNNHSPEVTPTTAEEPDGNAASETATAPLVSMYSVASDEKTIEVTSALAEETHWSILESSEPTGMTTVRGTKVTQLRDGQITTDGYFTEEALTDPGDKTEENAAIETVTAPLASMYSLGGDSITATDASTEIVQRSSSTAAEGEITNKAIGLSSSASAEFTDGTNNGRTDNNYFTVATLTDPGDESDDDVDNKVETTSLVLMSSIGGDAATIEMTHTSIHEEQRSSFTAVELESATNTNAPSSNAAEWSPGASNDSSVSSSYFSEQTSTVNGDTTDGNVSSALLVSMASDDQTASAIDTSPAAEDLQWSKTSILKEMGTTLVNTPASSTGERFPIATDDDSSLTEATLADRDSTIEDFDASVTQTAETADGLDVSLTTPSNETETTPTSEASSLGPPIDNDTMAEIRRNNSVVVSLSMSLAEYTKEFDYKFRSAVANAANDYCKRNSCYVSGSSGGAEGAGGMPRVRRAAVSPAPASPTTGGSTAASAPPEATSATTFAVLFTVADVGILPGYPVSNGAGGIDVATYLSPPAGFGFSAGSAKAFVVSGTILVAIISANRDAVADALGVNVTRIIWLPEKIALDAATSTQAAASTAAAAIATEQSPLWVTLVASLVSIAAVLLVIAAVIFVVKKLKRQGSASVSPSITKLNEDERPSTSSSGDMWYASGSVEISHAHRNRNMLEELDVSTSLWYENSLPKEAPMGRRRVYRISKDVPTLQYSPPEDTSYFQSISPPPSYSALPPIRHNR